MGYSNNFVNSVCSELTLTKSEASQTVLISVNTQLSTTCCLLFVSNSPVHKTDNLATGPLDLPPLLEYWSFLRGDMGRDQGKIPLKNHIPVTTSEIYYCCPGVINQSIQPGQINMFSLKTNTTSKYTF